MTIRMRIVQTFSAAHAGAFLALEKRFAELEAQRSDFPQGRRFCPIAAVDPTNTLIWEADFPTLDAAHGALRMFAADTQHEDLAVQQRPFFRDVRIEFLESLL
jgi:hypothetical protein